MRKIILSLISLLMCMLMLCSCIYYPDTEKEVSSTDNNASDSSDTNAPVDLMANEIVPEGNTAIIMNDVKGKSDEQAETMRNKILNAKDELKITGTTYYISSKNGNDNNDGLSPKTPWATADAISTNAWQMKEGDAILFERGCVYRPSTQIFCKSGLTYGAYGEGSKPAIYGSIENYAKPGYWEPSTKKNVWKLSLPLTDAGIIVFNHGEAVGIKQAGLLTLTKNGDYYHNATDNILYLYLDKGRPNQVYKDIEIGTRRAIFTLNTKVKDVTIDNICMKYTGNFGVQAIGFHDNITVSNCEIGWIGGSYMIDGDTGRYGNGIQFWDSASNTIVKDCWIYQVYDTGVTFQGGYYANYDNVQFVDNLIEYCTMSIEFWNQKRQNYHKEPDGDIKNIKICGNICRFAGYGWGVQRYNPSQTAHIQAGASYVYFVSSMEISNNIFDKTTHSIISWDYHLMTPKDNDIVIKNNTYYKEKGETENTLSIPGSNGWLTAKNQAQLESIVKQVDQSPKEIAWVS